MHKTILRRADFRGSKFGRSGVAKKFFGTKEMKGILNEGREKKDVYAAFKKAADANHGRLTDNDVAEVVTYLGKEKNSISKSEAKRMSRALEKEGLSMRHANMKGYRHAQKTWGRPLSDTKPKEIKKSMPMLTGGGMFGNASSKQSRFGSTHAGASSLGAGRGSGNVIKGNFGSRGGTGAGSSSQMDLKKAA